MTSRSFGDVKLPAIFGDHMVLQRDAKAPIWGWADPGEPVTVTAGDAKATATAGADGKWMVALQGLKASDQAIDVTIAGKNNITLHDVLVGDVWVCSGQSNMEWTLNRSAEPDNAISQANDPMLRLYTVPKNVSDEPLATIKGNDEPGRRYWLASDSDSAAKFSAVGATQPPARFCIRA